MLAISWKKQLKVRWGKDFKEIMSSLKITTAGHTIREQGNKWNNVIIL